MKKLSILFAAAAAALSFASCNKEQLPAEQPSAPEIKFNITVGNLDGTPDTKAIKNSWVAGDKINVWFDETNYSNPDLILTYDGSTWTPGTINKTPNASGNLIVLYEGYNDWSQYSHNSEYMIPVINKFAGAVNGYSYAQPMAYANDSAIAYTYESNTLTADLNSWKSLTKIQVVVTGLNSADAANYALREQNMSRGIAFFNTTSITTSNTTMGGATVGVPNEDGVAFYFTGTRNDPSSRTFTLLDLTTMQEKVYSVTGKTIETGTRKVVGIKITADKFQVQKGEENGDLGLSVKWATSNLGATSSVDFGNLYQWGGLEDVSGTSNCLTKDNCPYSGWTKYVPSGKSSYWAGSGSPDNKTVLELVDDAANATLKGSWRIPTYEEWDELQTKCEWIRIQYDSVDGYMVLSKVNGNWIFLPIGTGFRFDIDWTFFWENSYYWSSTLNKENPDNAYGLELDQWGNITLHQYFSRCNGYAIRPVCTK